MTIIQLEYIVAVDTYKSFAEAAGKCFVSQPALSMQIKKIEEELGVLIFDRSKKPVLTTDIGKQIIKQAREALRQIQKIHEIVDNQRGEVGGELRVGIIPTLSPYLLPLFITSFLESYPNVQLSIEELLSDDIIHKLNNDLIDVGILVSPLDDRSLVELPLFYERFLIYASEHHPFAKRNKVSIHELSFDDMWVLQEGHCFRNQVVNLCSEQGTDIKGQLRFESGSLETIKRIVEHQSGYTLLPELAAQDMPASKQKYIKSFSDQQPVREVSIVVHRSFMKKKLIEALKAEILRSVPASFKDKNRGTIVKWM